ALATPEQTWRWADTWGGGGGTPFPIGWYVVGCTGGNARERQSGCLFWKPVDHPHAMGHLVCFPGAWGQRPREAVKLPLLESPLPDDAMGHLVTFSPCTPTLHRSVFSCMIGQSFRTPSSLPTSLPRTTPFPKGEGDLLL